MAVGAERHRYRRSPDADLVGANSLDMPHDSPNMRRDDCLPQGVLGSDCWLDPHGLQREQDATFGVGVEAGEGVARVFIRQRDLRLELRGRLGLDGLVALYPRGDPKT